MHNKPLFVTGIGTGIGKTVFSSILCTALDADYWKPVQAGDLEHSDSIFVKKHATLNKGKVLPEGYCLKFAMSPHKAAELEQVEIDRELLDPPATENNLVIEGAGGLMVPITTRFTYLDYITELNPRVFLVVKNYLGSINHTLLSIAALQSRSIDVAGLIIMGDQNEGSEQAYEEMGKLPIIARIPWAKPLNASFVKEQAQIVRASILQQEL
ncbi:dethiobiotin synthase [Luteibaculum oceani]|uniref:ATP-dependent dethiobiotin synthetase BioD n=1 Tax=Luteibaculum oceani TaxID=1294296 RepID=A0A5C6V2X1_9FLAO|nr:dethiobiotin synthase [Luteibaculum oceani]TXC78836.1 dethiobiotin synthase [Luteibaculum oceani]